MNKQQAQERITQIEKELQELSAIINQPEKTKEQVEQ